ncbi:MAG: RagB/SusD family nutrient uptake outer membrane protein [Saprospiraceae bacterium]|nr:RagB/SusD family nutrient uptake outer membrane protein [Saprospiraceae bacterium]
MAKQLKYKLRTGIICLFALFGAPWGCTDLEENVLDESFRGTGQAEAISGAIAPAYGYMRRGVWRHTIYFGLQEVTSDEAILPARGGTDWFDGGKYIALHTHQMTPGNGVVRDAWNGVTTNISRALSAIEVLRPLAEGGDSEAQSALYEMIAMRAYLNMLMMDSWGLAFRKESSVETSTILRGQEAIDYIQSEFESVVNVINTDRGPGRFTQGAVWGLLARLHLNAGVYRDPYGTPSFEQADMSKAIEYCDLIINSGNYRLSPEYFDLFNDDNNGNSELIFALDQRGQLSNEHGRWAYWSVSGDMLARPEWIADGNPDGTNGPAMTPDFYQTWLDAYGDVDPAEADARFFKRNVIIPEEISDLTGLSPANDDDNFFCVPPLEFQMDRGILRGVQWGPREGADGNFVACDDGAARIYPVREGATSSIREGEEEVYVTHVPKIDFTTEGSFHNTGYRYAKHQFSKTSSNGTARSSVDLVLLRLGEVYLNRAEAKMRIGDTGGALADINTLRTSRNARPDQTPAALASIDLERLYDERGFELYWEGHRRNDQIRFGKFEDTWTEKSSTSPQKRLFPIPQSAIDGASNLEGFLVQNPGY